MLPRRSWSVQRIHQGGCGEGEDSLRWEWSAACCPGGPAECGADARVVVRGVWTVWGQSNQQRSARSALRDAVWTPGRVWGGVDSARCIPGSTNLPVLSTLDCDNVCVVRGAGNMYGADCIGRMTAVRALHPGFGATLPPPPPRLT